MSKIKILYVDDELTNLLLFKANLEEDYEVFTSNNGAEGLEELSRTPQIRLVISDMKMPGMNGIEFIKAAKQANPNISYYILTGFEITEEIQESLNSGLIRKYFKKPFDLNEISTEIKSALSQ